MTINLPTSFPIMQPNTLSLHTVGEKYGFPVWFDYQMIHAPEDEVAVVFRKLVRCIPKLKTLEEKSLVLAHAHTMLSLCHAKDIETRARMCRIVCKAYRGTWTPLPEKIKGEYNTESISIEKTQKRQDKKRENSQIQRNKDGEISGRAGYNSKENTEKNTKLSENLVQTRKIMGGLMLQALYYHNPYLSLDRKMDDKLSNHRPSKRYCEIAKESALLQKKGLFDKDKAIYWPDVENALERFLNDKPNKVLDGQEYYKKDIRRRARGYDAPHLNQFLQKNSEIYNKNGDTLQIYQINEEEEINFEEENSSSSVIVSVGNFENFLEGKLKEFELSPTTKQLMAEEMADLASSISSDSRKPETQFVSEEISLEIDDTECPIQKNSDGSETPDQPHRVLQGSVSELVLPEPVTGPLEPEIKYIEKDFSSQSYELQSLEQQVSTISNSQEDAPVESRISLIKGVKNWIELANEQHSLPLLRKKSGSMDGRQSSLQKNKYIVVMRNGMYKSKVLKERAGVVYVSGENNRTEKFSIKTESCGKLDGIGDMRKVLEKFSTSRSNSPLIIRKVDELTFGDLYANRGSQIFTYDPSTKECMCFYLEQREVDPKNNPVNDGVLIRAYKSWRGKYS